MRSIILFSGGPDSVAALEVARQETTVVGLLHFRSGGFNPTSNSAAAARSLASYYKLPMHSLPYAHMLPDNYFESLLTEYPYLPDRNLFFLTTASAWIKKGLFESGAGGAKISRIYTGFVRGGQEGSDEGIYDITPDFVSRLNSLLALDTTWPLEVVAPFAGQPRINLFDFLLFKAYAPLHLTWSCYEETKANPCGVCAACLGRIAVFKVMGVRDSLRYSEGAEPNWEDCIPWKEYYDASVRSSTPV